MKNAVRGLKGWPERDLTFNPTLREFSTFGCTGICGLTSLTWKAISHLKGEENPHSDLRAITLVKLLCPHGAVGGLRG